MRLLLEGNRGRFLSAALCFAIALIVLLDTSARALPQTKSAPAQQECSKDTDFKQVRGIGKACRLKNGNWKVKLKDGSTVETHGPDGVNVAPSGGAGGAVAAQSSHACVPSSDYYGLIIYAYASDRGDNYASVAPMVSANFQGAQDRLYQEFQSFGLTGSYKMLCNSDGSVRIDRAQLATAYNNADFGTIVSDLRALGYTDPRAKYWVWYDGSPPAAPYCGQGSIHYDDSLGEANLHNGNSDPLFGLNYGCNAMMHENGHNLGAVQLSSPQTSGGWHCNDGWDVMCYADGGSSSNYQTICSDREYFDCNHDDYFHPSPAAGSYLSSHWNLAACYNRYIQRSGCGATPSVTPTPTTPACTAPAWNSASAYSTDTLVSYNGHEWRAKWWSQGEAPGSGGQWGAWEDRGPCSGGATATATSTLTPEVTTATPTRTATSGVTATATRTRTATSGVTATPTRTFTSTGAQPWAVGVAYTPGTLVTYGGNTYRCRQSHTSQVGWEPSSVPALWELA